MARASFTTIAERYAHEVVDGVVPACYWTRKACERHLEDRNRFKGASAPYIYDGGAVEYVCAVVQHFPHIKGDWARQYQLIELQPWQVFLLAVVFGWKRRDTRTRRFRTVYIEIPRKNGKTIVSATVGNYMVACDGESGATVVCAANTREQARFLFDDAKAMASRERGYREQFGVSLSANAITQVRTASKFYPVSAEDSNLDGLNLHAALVDELHAHKTRGLWDVLNTAMGSRIQPIMWAITTAGVNRASICYEQRLYVQEILDRRIEDETYFGLIYTIDPDDDPFIEPSWKKANPNFGVSIYPEYLRQQAQHAQQMPSATNAYLTKHCNVWVNAQITWLRPGSWDKCADPGMTMQMFAGDPCYIGIDLAQRSDITAVIIAFPPHLDRDYWAVFGRYYLPEDTIARSENTHYQGWERIGRLASTPGNITDFDFIVDQLSDTSAQHDVREIAIDPFDAGPLIVDIEKAGMRRPVEVRQTAPNLSPAMVELEGLVLSRKIRHDGDPVLGWMISNVKVARSGDLMKPDKESDERKIDGVVALLMCIHRAMKAEPAPDYSEGLWVI